MNFRPWIIYLMHDWFRIYLNSFWTRTSSGRSSISDYVNNKFDFVFGSIHNVRKFYLFTDKFC